MSESSDRAEVRLSRIDTEIERLAAGVRALDRDRRQVKHSLWGLPLAAPAGVFLGPVAATLVVLGTLSLWATSVYLIGVRRREYIALIHDCRQDKQRVQGNPGDRRPERPGVF